ncbi:MAG TPA: phosphoribosyltransferase [Acidobacteriaceae bacterium]|jgi:predicted phosphoribosyltransferase
MLFRDRRDAGRILAQAMTGRSRSWMDAIVLGLPRGGVPVAFEIARELSLPLDILIVRKLGVPGQEELAMGAVASGGAIVINQAVVHELGISLGTIEAVAKRERLEIDRREQDYRGGRRLPRVEDRTTILVDDGLATGSSMLAAVRSLRPRAQQIVVAVPVAAKSTCEELRGEVDEVICAATPREFSAVGGFYRDFAQTTDKEVRDLLAQACHDEPDEREDGAV